jgi:hypothetical protein
MSGTPSLGMPAKAADTFRGFCANNRTISIMSMIAVMETLENVQKSIEDGLKILRFQLFSEWLFSAL